MGSAVLNHVNSFGLCCQQFHVTYHEVVTYMPFTNLKTKEGFRRSDGRVECNIGKVIVEWFVQCAVVGLANDFTCDQKGNQEDNIPHVSRLIRC